MKMSSLCVPLHCAVDMVTTTDAMSDRQYFAVVIRGGTVNYLFINILKFKAMSRNYMEIIQDFKTCKARLKYLDNEIPKAEIANEILKNDGIESSLSELIPELYEEQFCLELAVVALNNEFFKTHLN